MGVFTNAFGIGVGQGANVNQIPFKSDALVWLDGTISGNNFVDKISGKLFPITGKDFSTDWTRGFPYKSAATISAPVGDATLIAGDLNNYWYTAGTPNQIPVVSLFQDIDYEHKMFCRHMPQMLDANGVEVFEPRVSDIVIYNTVKTGSDLVECQVKYNVPAEVTTSVKWVSKTGLNTNTGTKASPWLTMQKANDAATANDTVYVKSGVYNEFSAINSSTYMWVSKTINYRAIGNNTIISEDASQQIRLISNNPNFYNFTFDARDIANYCIGVYTVGNKVSKFESCIFKNYKLRFVVGGSSVESLSFKNCNFNGKISSVYATQMAYMSATSIDTCRSINNTLNLYYLDCEIKNSNIVTDKAISINAYNVGLNCYGNKISYQFGSIHQGGGVDYTSGKIVNIHHNTIVNTSQGGESVGIGLIFQGNVIPKINNNVFSENALSFTTTTYFAIIKGATQECCDNHFYSKATTEFCHVFAVGVGSKINNNISHGNSLFGTQLTIGGETSITGQNDNSEFIGNRVIGHFLENPSLTGTCHGVLLSSGVNMDIRHNNISHETLGLVVKTNALPYTAKGVFYNKVEKCGKALWIRGCTGLNVFGNTLTREDSSADFAVYMDENSAAAGTQNCENIILKNNIIKGSAQNKLIGMDQWAADHGCIAQNNVMSGGSVLLAAGSTSYASLAVAQAAGKLLNCVVSDPLLDANLIPATPIVIGEVLDSAYNSGLDITTNWGNSSTLPVIVNKTQPVTGNWQAGAYIQ